MSCTFTEIRNYFKTLKTIYSHGRSEMPGNRQNVEFETTQFSTLIEDRQILGRNWPKTGCFCLGEGGEVAAEIRKSQG